MVPKLLSFDFEILYSAKVCKYVREWGSHVYNKVTTEYKP